MSNRFNDAWLEARYEKLRADGLSHEKAAEQSIIDMEDAEQDYIDMEADREVKESREE